MNVDIATARYRSGDPGVVAVPREHPSVVAVFDGVGSWGSGMEAAAWVRERIAGEWERSAPGSLAACTTSINQAAALIPSELAGPEFDLQDYSFSVAAVEITSHGVFLTSAGSLGILRVSGSLVEPLGLPSTWVGQQVAAGLLTPQEAATHPLRHVCVGPFVSATEQRSLSLSGPYSSSAVFVVAHLELFQQLQATPTQAWLTLGARELQNIPDHAGARLSPVVVLRPSGAA